MQEIFKTFECQSYWFISTDKQQFITFKSFAQNLNAFF